MQYTQIRREKLNTHKIQRGCEGVGEGIQKQELFPHVVKIITCLKSSFKKLSTDNLKELFDALSTCGKNHYLPEEFIQKAKH